MSTFDKVIQQAQEILYCLTCGRSYQEEEIKIRGFFDNILILQTVCKNNHEPVVTFFVTTFQTSRALSRPLKPLSSQDVLDMHLSLEKFDGDFEELWKKSKNQP